MARSATATRGGSGEAAASTTPLEEESGVADSAGLRGRDADS